MAFTINGNADTPTPSTLDVSYKDVNGGVITNAYGEEIVYRIRQRIVLNVGYKMLEDSVLNQLLKDISEVYVPVNFYNPILKKEETKQFKVSEKSQEVEVQNDSQKRWKSIAFTLTEK